MNSFPGGSMAAVPSEPRARSVAGRPAGHRGARGKELDILIVGGGIVGAGAALDAVHPRAERRASWRRNDWACGHVVAVLQTHPRRPALPGDAGLRPGPGGAARARAAALSACAAPGPAGAVPVSADQTVRGAALRGRRASPCTTRMSHHRRAQPRRARSTSTCPGAGPSGRRPASRTTPSSGPSATTTRQVDDAQYVANLVRTAAALRRPRGEPDWRSSTSCARANAWSAPGCATTRTAVELQHPGQAGHQRHRRVDGRDPGHGHRPRPVQGAGLQGHPPGGAAGPLPVHRGPDPAHREVRAVRHSMGPALDHRHHGHRLAPGQGPSGGLQQGHRLHPRARQQGAASGPLTREDVEGVYAGLRPLLAGENDSTAKLSREHVVAHPVPGPRRRRRRQVDHLPGDGQGRRGRGHAEHGRAGAAAAAPSPSRCSVPAASRPPGTSATGWPRKPGIHVARVEHLLNRYGSMAARGAGAHRRATRSWREPLPGADDYLARRSGLRRHARGRPARPGRPDPPDPDLHRGLGPRCLRRPGSR